MTAIRSRIASVLPTRVKDALFDAFIRAGTTWNLIRRRRSKFVSSHLTGLKGIEIGAGGHNRFYLDAINVDRYAGDDTVYKDLERQRSGRIAKVDVVASGDDLPFADNSYDFVFSSHVIEHFPDPIKTLREWVRVSRSRVVVIAPHRDRTADSDRPLSTVDELLQRHRENFTSEQDRHWSVWTCESFVEMCEAAGLRVIDCQDPDDKVGNGFTVVIDASVDAARSPQPGPATEPSRP
jgi:SAM-dependent methyltransferase